MSEGVAVRVAFAVSCALIGGISLLRSLLDRASGRPVSSGPAAALRAILLLLSGFWLIVWVVIAALRFHYPYELEWSCGAMRDHCARLLAGQPIFAAPSIEWIPYFYAPLYMQISAFLMRLSGGRVSFEAMRAVSDAATVANAAMIWVWTDLLVRHGAAAAGAAPGAGDASGPGARNGAQTVALQRYWTIVPVGLFFAAYRMTGAWYDIERIDSLFLFWSLLAGLWVYQALRPGTPTRSAAYAALAGLVLGLALLTKQQALVYLVAAGLCLAWSRRWGALAAYIAAAAATSLGGIWLDSLGTHGWFWRYCFELPVGQGFQRDLAILFIVKDMMLFAPCLAILAAALWASRRWGGTGKADPPIGTDTGKSAFVTFATAGVLVSFTSRAHWGGYENVLIPAFVFTGMAASIAAAGLEARNRASGLPLLLLALAQFLTLTYRPDKQIPTAEEYAAGAKYTAAVRSEEKIGRVLSYTHGGFTSTPRVHVGSVVNFPLARRPIPEAFRQGMLSGYYDTIFVDMPPEATGDFAPLVRNYRVAECLQITKSWIVTGYETPNPQGQVWILRKW